MNLQSLLNRWHNLKIELSTVEAQILTGRKGVTDDTVTVAKKHLSQAARLRIARGIRKYHRERRKAAKA